MAGRVSWGNTSNQYGNRLPIREHQGAFGQREVNYSTLQRYPAAGPYGNDYSTAQAWTTSAEKRQASAEMAAERAQAARQG